ncbi:MAG TPA: hypothetical protein VFQ85_11620 [Mycobacteriales bacterium]|jgi:hypothetical protein|nr:hypothetical protein [Mycobacteriales bacterium]
MTSQARPAALVAAGLACVLATGVGAVAARRPSAVPGPPPGHPGNPVVVADAAFAVTGRASSLVHVRLRKALDAPHPADTRRFDFTTTGGWGAVVLRREDGTGPALEAATVTPRFACGRDTCPNATLVDSAPANARVEPGDYVLVLAGPPGSTVSYTLRGFDGTEKVTKVGHLYAVPFAAAPIAPAPAPPTSAAYQADRGAWTLPTLGRRMLAGVVLAVDVRGGGGYDFALCPGAYGSRSAQADAVAAARPTCTGYSSSVGSIVGRDPLAHPLPGSDDGYVNVTAASQFGTYEGVTGASYAVHCEHPPCGYAAAGYVLALDS